jgi:hypothetical protein
VQPAVSLHCHYKQKHIQAVQGTYLDTLCFYASICHVTPCAVTFGKVLPGQLHGMCCCVVSAVVLCCVVVSGVVLLVLLCCVVLLLVVLCC